MLREGLRAGESFELFKIGSNDSCLIFSLVFEKILSHTVAVELMGKLLETFDMASTSSQGSEGTWLSQWQPL